MDIEYTNSKATWSNNSNVIKYETKGIEFATEDNSLIYIETCNDGLYEYHYINLEGQIILSYSDEAQYIIFYDGNMEKRIVEIPFLSDVSLGYNTDVFVLAGENDIKKLYEYSKKGDKIKEYLPPVGYTFYRISDVGKSLVMVCQGNNNTKDNYGRNDWKFQLNQDEGEWERISLAY